MDRTRPRVRIPLGRWLLAYVAQKIMSTRLKPLAPPFSSRPIASPDTVMVPTRHGNVRCFIYQPHSAAPLAAHGVVPPVHINIHGGGFIFTSAHQDDHIADYIAAEVGAVVVSIDYSTAPQVQYPVAEEQCFDVLCWIADHAEEQGWDARRISVGGGSAGAKLALNILQQTYLEHGPRISAAALIVPFVDATLPPESYASPKAKPVIGPWVIDLIQGSYFADAARRPEPLASPALDPGLGAVLPPTVVLTGEYDTVRAQSASLFSRLEAEGAPVTYRQFDKADHDWIASVDTSRRVVRQSLEMIVTHLVKHLATEDAAGDEGVD